MQQRSDMRVFFIIFIVLMLSTFAIAQGSGGGSRGGPLSTLGGGIEQFFDFIQPVLAIVLGQEAPSEWNLEDNTASNYIARIMIFLIIFAIMFSVVSRITLFNDFPVVEWVLTIAISILATRWLSDNGTGLLQAVILPYNAVGVSITAFLPIIIYFFFLEVGFQGGENKFIRRAGWIIFAVIFTFLWFTSYNYSADESAFLIYPISAGLCILFYIFDRPIQKIIRGSEAERVTRGMNERLIEDLYDRLRKLENIISGSSDDKLIRKSKKQMEKIKKQIKEYSADSST